MAKLFGMIFLGAGIVVLVFAGDGLGHFNDNRRLQMEKSEPNEAVVDANSISIKVIFDNNPYKEGMRTAWGFSCVISSTEKTILFDTGGDGRLLLENMSKMGIDANGIETVVLSHIHSDHTGGLWGFLRENPKVCVYMPKSFPEKIKGRVTSCGAKYVEVGKQTKICEGVYSTGQMGLRIREQGLVIRTDKGMIVITGCAHPGIVKMVRAAKDLYNERILLVMGGFHLEWATEGKIKNIIKAFKELDVKYVGPCHCTGGKARAIFEKHYTNSYINVGLGKVVEIKDLQ